MDLRGYFGEMRAKEAELASRFPDGVIHVTSLFYRERNSTPGMTCSATARNAARVITDGTHREATSEEIKGFLDHQQNELRKTIRSEQIKKQQYVVVMDPREPGDAAMSRVAHREPLESASKK